MIDLEYRALLVGGLILVLIVLAGLALLVGKMLQKKQSTVDGFEIEKKKPKKARKPKKTKPVKTTAQDSDSFDDYTLLAQQENKTMFGKKQAESKPKKQAKKNREPDAGEDDDGVIAIRPQAATFDDEPTVSSFGSAQPPVPTAPNVPPTGFAKPPTPPTPNDPVQPSTPPRRPSSPFGGKPAVKDEDW